MTNFYTAISAWREMLVRIFADIPAQENASPTWLVNPATRRRLKLDCYYPDAAIAFRFVGLTAKGQPRQSDWEVMEEEQRDQTRAELCRQNGVDLFLIEPLDDVVKQLDDVILALARSSRKVLHGSLPQAQKAALQARLAAARHRAEEVRRLLVRNPEQMVENLAAAYRDRESGTMIADPTPLPPPQSQTQRELLGKLAVGMRVAHTKFGAGVITGVGGNGDLSSNPDATLTIAFDGEETPRTFLANLVADKLTQA